MLFNLYTYILCQDVFVNGLSFIRIYELKNFFTNKKVYKEINIYINMTK